METRIRRIGQMCLVILGCTLMLIGVSRCSPIHPSVDKSTFNQKPGPISIPLPTGETVVKDKMTDFFQVSIIPTFEVKNNSASRGRTSYDYQSFQNGKNVEKLFSPDGEYEFSLNINDEKRKELNNENVVIELGFVVRLSQKEIEKYDLKKFKIKIRRKGVVTYAMRIDASVGAGIQKEIKNNLDSLHIAFVRKDEKPQANLDKKEITEHKECDEWEEDCDQEHSVEKKPLLTEEEIDAEFLEIDI